MFFNECSLKQYLTWCVYPHVSVHSMACMGRAEITGQLVEVGSTFPPCEIHGLNSGSQAWRHAHFPTELYLGFYLLILKVAE